MGPIVQDFGIAFLASSLLTFPVRALVRRFGIVDRPNQRSSHRVETPRAGGLAIVLAFFLVAVCLVPLDRGLAFAGACVAALAVVSLCDDVRSLSFKIRLAAQVLAAALFVIGLDLPVRALDLPGLSWPLPAWLGLGLAILFLVAYCNFFNFMDGINGLAAGQGSLTALALAILLWSRGDALLAGVAAILAGAAAGFLPHNYPAAKIFMGDVGSVTLGFALAGLSQAAHARDGVPWTALLLVHAVFLFDACFTLLKRASRGEAFWLPHREHNYQRLVRGGWSHARTSLTFWLLTVESCLAGLVYARGGGAAGWAALLVTAALLITLTAFAHWKPVEFKSEPKPAVLAVEQTVDG